ncbi:MAG: hypothetical protein LBV27_01665 [Oscillospiraceae bacterium]|jgi:hypothetical protein|nr:hypothetical protein [Oscillospiraceae bacterium]
MSNPWNASSTGKTQNYKLDQWQAGDKPGMADFNYDNFEIDKALGQLNASRVTTCFRALPRARRKAPAL